MPHQMGLPAPAQTSESTSDVEEAKIIRLEARRLRILKSASSDEFWDPVQLLKQRLVEIASTLVGGKFLMPVGRDVQRVPRDKHGTGLLLAVETE